MQQTTVRGVENYGVPRCSVRTFYFMKSLILALLPLWHSQWHKFPKGEEGEVVLLIRGEK